MSTLAKFCFSALLFTLVFAGSIHAQSSGFLSGKVLVDNVPATGAVVHLEEVNKYATTDEHGAFAFEEVAYGQYHLTASSIGAQDQRKEVTVDRAQVTLNFALKQSVNVLGQSTITAVSKSTEMESKAIAIKSLDAKALSSEALGAQELLKRATGVVVRQEGGLGSRTAINLNGMTGNAVRIYYDGIPLEVYGGGIRLNNLPIDVLERIDVYKGVMPVHVGTDALGGGINLVPYQSQREYVRASYSAGSFNTHQITFRGKKRITERFSLGVLAFANYADNDYVMRGIKSLTENTLDNGTVFYTEEEVDARRFHNQHKSAFAEVTAGWSRLHWADQLELSASYSARHDELQHGRLLLATAFGEATRGLNTFSGRLDWRKRLLNDKLQLRYFGIVSRTETNTVDSTDQVFTWSGQPFDQLENASGAEVTFFPSMRSATNTGTAQRLTASYALGKHITFNLSDFYRFSEIVGNDPIGPRLNLGGEPIDPNTIPATIQRNIFGAAVRAVLWQERLDLQAFYKYYTYQAESIDILQVGASQLPVRNVDANQDGYGAAIKFKLSETLSVRSSYEQAVRIPVEEEIFGDFAGILPNYEIRPEQSNNLNLGWTFDKAFWGMKGVRISVEGFLRNRIDLIRVEEFGPENAIYVNEASVDGKGIEFSLDANPIEALNVSFNLTRQSNIITTPTLSVGSEEGAEVPNIPNFFHNTNLRYNLKDVVREGDVLTLSWSYFFTRRFSINEVADLVNANPDFVIPNQHLQNAGVTYTPAAERWQYALSVGNLTNAEVFDNFRIPRPGINLAFKINYSFK